MDTQQQKDRPSYKDLTAQLAAEQARIAGLEEQLAAEKRRAAGLEEQLTAERARAGILEEQLAQRQQEPPPQAEEVGGVGTPPAEERVEYICLEGCKLDGVWFKTGERYQLSDAVLRQAPGRFARPDAVPPTSAAQAAAQGKAAAAAANDEGTRRFFEAQKQRQAENNKVEQVRTEQRRQRLAKDLSALPPHQRRSP